MASITVYKHANFGGRSETFTTEVSNFKDVFLDDEVSSVTIPIGSTWMLYENMDFQGQVSILGPGDYATPNSMCLKNDTLSSLRPFPSVIGPTCLLFKDTHYRGRMVVAITDTPNLISIGFNEVLSSVIVLQSNWTFYKDINYGGTEVVLKPGRYPQPIQFKNDDISSLRPTDSIITVYKHNNFLGRSETFSGPVSNMIHIGFNDQVSSCKIEPGSTWMLYQHVDFQGHVSILGADDYPNAHAMGYHQ